MRIVIQASSKSWSGGADLCMNMLDGKTVLQHTYENALKFTDDVIVAAPEFDRGNLNEFPAVYGYDSSPLQRLLMASEDLPATDRIIRVDGLHCFADFETAVEMYECPEYFTVAKFADDVPPQLGCDVYNLHALRGILWDNPPLEFHVHPKFWLAKYYKVKYWPAPTVDREMIREAGKQIYLEERLEVGDGIWAGDQLRFHYETAGNWIGDKTLDIACGNGFGVEMLHDKAEMHGADYDSEALPEGDNFYCEDVMDMSFHDSSFDCVISMETFEHVDPDKYLSEIKRVLRPDGHFIMSTPQNCMGGIPLNSQHLKEYSLRELKEKVGQYFDIQKVIGIKAGRIVIPDDPIGNNTMLGCVNA